MYRLHLAPAYFRSKWLLVAKLHRLFDYFDANGDGFLQRDEAVDCLTKIAKDEGLEDSRGKEAAVDAFQKARLVTDGDELTNEHRLSFGELVHYVLFETKDANGNVGWTHFDVEDVDIDTKLSSLAVAK